MIEQHTLKVPRTARYATIGQAGADTRYFWLACHGYGQLAHQFIRKFDVLARPDTFILAPEGLSRFYWQGVSNRPVASWMTKEGRLDEIADYTHYLTTLYTHYRQQMPPDVNIILFGFSQGCATQVRWIAAQQPVFHHLCLWAGTIPEDIDYVPLLPYLNSKHIHSVFGDQDPFLTPERLTQHQDQIAASGIQWQSHTFAGEHNVDREVLRRWAEEHVYLVSGQ